MQNTVNIKCTAEEGAVLPAYKTVGAAGADIGAFTKEDIIIGAGKTVLVPTGLYFEIPSGFEIQVRPRSGLAAKNKVTVLNAPGTIDSDYRGEIQVILINLGNEPFTVHNGDRIAQIVVAPVVRGNFIKTEQLSDTTRGAAGFGSTGVSTKVGK